MRKHLFQKIHRTLCQAAVMQPQINLKTRIVILRFIERHFFAKLHKICFLGSVYRAIKFKRTSRFYFLLNRNSFRRRTALRAYASCQLIKINSYVHDFTPSIKHVSIVRNDFLNCCQKCSLSASNHLYQTFTVLWCHGSIHIITVNL